MFCVWEKLTEATELAKASIEAIVNFEKSILKMLSFSLLSVMVGVGLKRSNIMIEMQRKEGSLLFI